MTRLLMLASRFFCGLRNHGETDTLTLHVHGGRYFLWECTDCGTQRWKRDTGGTP